MKKILSVFVVLGMISCALFAKESSNKWYENLSAGGLLRLGFPTFGLEIHNRYEFPITESIHIDAGLNLNLCSGWGLTVSSGNDSVGVETAGLSLIPNVSFWFKDFYAYYGLGLGFATETMFIPYDVRIGWQPGSSKKEKGVLFNMELGLIGTPSLSFENEKITDKQLVPCIFATLGAMYKF